MNKMTSLTDFLKDHAASKAVSFYMPGHKGSEFFRRLGYGEIIENLVDFDITEIPRADNLFDPKLGILRTMEKYRELYDVKKSFLSVGGSSNGLIAAILSAINGPEDGIIIAKNSHRSVYNGATLSGGKVYLANPEMEADFDIPGEISVMEIERAFEEAQGRIKAVVIGSPNYYGLQSYVRGIADFCHKNGAVLIVDQAHGAHLKFMKKWRSHLLPSEWNWNPAEELGGDIVVNSSHKTLASFTQTSIVNLCSTEMDEEVLQKKLEMIQTSSPSYILMTSLDLNGDIIERYGEELFSSWQENLMWFYEEAKNVKGLKLLNSANHDKSKILMDMTDLGLNGRELASKLAENNIITELSETKFAMALTGIGNTKKDYEALLKALMMVSKTL